MEQLTWYVSADHLATSRYARELYQKEKGLSIEEISSWGRMTDYSHAEILNAAYCAERDADTALAVLPPTRDDLFYSSSEDLIANLSLFDGIAHGHPDVKRYRICNDWDVEEDYWYDDIAEE